MMKVNAVKCDACGRLHEEAANTYFSVHGNIYIGLEGGVVGNNLDDNGTVSNVSVFCKPGCMAEVLGIKTASSREIVINP